MNKTFVFTKTGAATLNGTLPVELDVNESITSITQGVATPTGAPSLVITSGVANPITFTASGGTNKVSYGIPLTIVTSLQTLVVTIAITVVDTAFEPYTYASPDSYQDLMLSLIHI